MCQRLYIKISYALLGLGGGNIIINIEGLSLLRHSLAWDDKKAWLIKPCFYFAFPFHCYASVIQGQSIHRSHFFFYIPH